MGQKRKIILLFVVRIEFEQVIEAKGFFNNLLFVIFMGGKRSRRRGDRTISQDPNGNKQVYM